MKFYVSFKTPDALEYGAKDAADSARERSIENDELNGDDASSEETKEITERVFEECMKAGKKWIKYGESITVMIDTVAGTCTVVP